MLFVQELAVLFGIALLGFLARKFKVFSEHANDVLTRLILYLTLPALILFSFHLDFEIALVKEFLWLLIMSLYVLVLSSILAAWLRKKALLLRSQRSVYEGLIIFGNQGFIGYAVIYMAYGDKGILYLTVFNIFYLLFIWTYGIYLFHRANKLLDWNNVFCNPGIVSTLAGILLFVSPIELPQAIVSGLEMVGMMTIPLAMLLIGSLLANVKTSVFLPLLRNVYLWKMTVVKLLVIPLLLLPFVALSAPLPLLYIAVIVSGMPSAPTISFYAQKYGGDTAFASIGVVITTICSIITIPILFWILSLLELL